MKKVLLTIMMIVGMLMFASPTHVYAAETLAATSNISPNGTYDGSIDVKETYNQYNFTVTSAGRLNITMTSRMPWYSLFIYSEDGTLVWSSVENQYNSNIQSVTNIHEVDLKAGNYFLKVSSYSVRRTSGHSYYTYYTGDYTMKLAFTSAGESFSEPNEDFVSATSIGVNAQVTGQIAKFNNDNTDVDADYFVFTLSAPGRITWDVTSYMNYYSMFLYNSDGEQIWTAISNKWNENLKKIENVHYVDLAEGTYYLKFNGMQKYRQDMRDRYAYYTGNYNFNMSFTSANVSYMAKDDDFASAYKVSPNVDINGQIAINDTSDIMTFTLAQDKEVGFMMTSYMPKYRIDLYDGNGKNVRCIAETAWNAELGMVSEEKKVELKAGTYYIKVTAPSSTGNYTLKLVERVLMKDTTIADIGEVACTGLEVTPNPTITYNGTTLVKDVDYTLTYANNINFGTGKVTITGIGNYAGTVTKEFPIVLKVGTVAVSGDYKFKFLNETDVAFAGLNNTEVTDISLNYRVSIGGKYFNITEVADKALYNNTKIKSVKLPSTIKTIGEKAFYGCTKLEKVKLASVVRIEKDAFTKCNKLKDVSGIGTGSVISIGKNRYNMLSDGTFEFARLENTKDNSLTIPSTAKIGAVSYKVTAIAAKAVDKTKIKTATIGKYVKTIGSKAFQKCTSLTKVTFKGKNIEIGSYAFDGCKKLKTISGGKGSILTVGSYKYKITDDKTVAVAGLKSTKTKKVEIGSTVKIGAKSYKITSIADKAFYDTNITSVVIGKNVKTIGTQAFYSCDSLKKVTIGTSVTKIGKQAFYGCRKLSSVTIHTKKLKSVGSNAFYYTKSNVKIVVPNSKYNAYVKLLSGKGLSYNARIVAK